MNNIDDDELGRDKKSELNSTNNYKKDLYLKTCVLKMFTKTIIFFFAWSFYCS